MRFTLSLLSVLLLAVPAHAAPSGKEIVEKVLEQPAPKEAKVVLKMTLKGKNEGIRQLTSYVKRDNGRVKSVVKFQEPADYRGAGILAIEESNGDVERWIRFNGQRRVRRLPAGSQSGSFLNTDFSYEDLDSRQDPKKDEHELLREEKVGGVDTYVVETIPNKDSNSAYKRIVQWIRKDNYVPVKIEFFAEGDKPVKRLEVQELKKIDGYWVSTKSTMSTLAEGTSTKLEIIEHDFKGKLRDNIFDKRFLQE